MPVSIKTCPCQVSPTFLSSSTAAAYSDCCQPYHNDIDKVAGVKAESAERLMRTRYSAFVLVNADYIVKTTVPAQQALLDINSIESWATETNWAGLKIITHAPKVSKRHAQVEFKAYYLTSEGVQAHHELSTFVKVIDKPAHNKYARWYFLDPTVAMTVSQKQPCICGSSEKFKRCCGVYLT